MKSEDALEAWLVGAAQKIPFKGEWWLVADAKESPLTTRTFWRTLARVVKKHHLRRTRTNIWTRSGSRMATLIQGDILVHACASTVPLSKSGTTGSITNGIYTNKNKIKTNHTCVRFAHLCVSCKKNSEEVSAGENMSGKSAREIAAGWVKKQAAGSDDQVELIEALLAAKQTKPRVADLWKVLFAAGGHGFAHNPGMKERASLFAWAKEFDEQFIGSGLKFGHLLQAVLLDYPKCRAYLLEHTTWKDANSTPNIAWLYYNRDDVVKWWVSTAKASKFKGATLS
jgi:hypothetical protein